MVAIALAITAILTIVSIAIVATVVARRIYYLHNNNTYLRPT